MRKQTHAFAIAALTLSVVNFGMIEGAEANRGVRNVGRTAAKVMIKVDKIIEQTIDYASGGFKSHRKPEKFPKKASKVGKEGTKLQKALDKARITDPDMSTAVTKLTDAADVALDPSCVNDLVACGNNFLALVDEAKAYITGSNTWYDFFWLYGEVPLGKTDRFSKSRYEWRTFYVPFWGQLPYFRLQFKADDGPLDVDEVIASYVDENGNPHGLCSLQTYWGPFYMYKKERVILDGAFRGNFLTQTFCYLESLDIRAISDYLIGSESKIGIKGYGY